MVPNRPPVRRRLVAAALALALVTAACGDDDDDASTDDAASTAAATSPAEPTDAAATTAAGSAPSESAPASTGASAAIEIPEELQGQAFTVAIYNNAPPGAFVEEGELKGYGPELTAALQQATGLEFEIEQVNSFDVLIPGLQGGRYDIAPDFFYVTPERLEVVDLVSMTKTAAGFGTAVDSDIVIEQPEDLCGLSAATLNGSAFPMFMEKITETVCTPAGLDAVAVSTFPNNAAGILAVSSGRADVYVATADQMAFIDGDGELTNQPYVYQERLEAIAVAKGSPLAEVLRQGMNAIIASGEYQQILDGWDVGPKAIEESEINPVENLE